MEREILNRDFLNTEILSDLPHLDTKQEQSSIIRQAYNVADEEVKESFFYNEFKKLTEYN